MNSFEWRVKELENKIIGQTNDIEFGESVCDQLDRVAKLYKNFIDTEGQNYIRFRTLYQKHSTLLNNVESGPTTSADETAKAGLVLAYEDDLTNHLEATKSMTEKAERVLSVDNWPDMSREKLQRLETITNEQHLQSTALDKRTEELINIYNDIIGSFKSNMVLWNKKLEAYENEERKLDEDE